MKLNEVKLLRDAVNNMAAYEWLSVDDYEPPLNKVCAARWESSIIEGLYSLALVTWDGEKWHFVSDGGEADVKEFAEVEE